MIDTSLMVAGLVTNHEHHDTARRGSLRCAHHGLPLATLDRRQHRLAVQHLTDAELLLPT